MSEVIAVDLLKQTIDRIERLEQEKSDLAQDIANVMAEAKANGLDTKTIRNILRLRKMDPADRAEQEELMHLYKKALNMVEEG